MAFISFLVGIIVVAIAYLLGSLSSAIIVSRYFGMDDPRTYGSGNPGASNMLRSGRKDAAALTLAGDALKGLIAVWIALCVQSLFDMGDAIVAWSALAVVIGHMWPLFFGFRGGKGVATALGVMIGLSFWTAVIVFAIWLMIAVKYKKSSLAALIAAAVAPFVSFIVQTHHPKLSWSLFFIAILILYRHKDNIKRLREGNELGIGEKAQPLHTPATETTTSTVEPTVEPTASDEEILDHAIAEEIANAEEFVEEVSEKAADSIEEIGEKVSEIAEEIKDKTEEVVKETAEKIQDKVEKTTKKLKEEQKDETAEPVIEINNEKTSKKSRKKSS